MLEIRNLEVFYNNVICGVKDVSLKVPEGGTIAFLGANGAGKTTTIRALTGLLKFHRGSITKGQISFKDMDITGWGPSPIAAAGIMQVPEGRRVFGQLTTEENLMLGSTTTSLNKSGRKKLAQKIYDYFPALQERSHLNAGFLSGGEQQMLAIGRGLMAQPKLLVIDELSLGLAPILVMNLAKTLIEVIRQEKLAILLVEQNASLALAITQYSYILENGAIALEGPSDTMKNNNLFKAYLGEAKRANH
jgi:branched-chain amino acid transport system ATP-binding protein